jgi:hypothetical protein
LWSGRSALPDYTTGKVTVSVPHGLQDASLNLIIAEREGVRWRLKPGQPLRRARRVPLGNIDDDRGGIQIVLYTAPVLTIKPVDENGRIVRGVAIHSEYELENPPAKFGFRSTTGDVGFSEQQDGRWRSSQMLPDEATTITLKKPGYEAKPQKVTLKEGATRELVFVLKSKPGK